MFKLSFLFVFLWTNIVFASALDDPNYWQQSIERCLTHPDQSEELISTEFKWGYTLLEMQDQFEETYASDKRLWLHASFDKNQDSFVLYHATHSSQPVITPFVITKSFIENVILQIETALQKGYASYVFFPDMGHSHLYFKEDHWQKKYQQIPVNEQPLLYQEMFADPELKALYHLSEQLEFKNENGQLLDDEVLQFKYWTRNYLGQNNHSGLYELPISDDKTKFNTVSSLPGYKLYSDGFAISSSHKGCFPYKDQKGVIRYFDIGLYDPRADMNDPSVYL